MIDTHAHPLLCKRPLEAFFNNAKNAGITHIIGVATSIQMGLDTLRLSHTYPQLIPTIGIHPCEAQNPIDLEQLSSLLTAHPEFKAIGEAGLDFYHKNAPLSQQQYVFETQLECAKTHQLPIIIHTRNADQEILPILQKYEDVKKVIHCFSSDIDFVKKTMNENTYYSFTGMITYANKSFLEDVITYIPLEKIMIETDCPYLTPTRLGKDENQSSYVSDVAHKIAQIKNLPYDHIAQITTKTAKQFFKL